MNKSTTLYILIGTGVGLIVTIVFGLIMLVRTEAAEARSAECTKQLRFTEEALRDEKPGGARLALTQARTSCSSAMGTEIDRLDDLLRKAERAHEERERATAVATQKKRAEEEAAERKRIAALTVAQAAAIARPAMTDTVNELSPAMAQLAAWAAPNMTWKSLQQVEPTTFGKMLKDPDSERGQRICVSGNIIEIEKVGATFLGKVGTYWGTSIIQFVAVGSTGDLVARSAASFCGIAIGKYSYNNSGGGVSHGVQAVGMFDLPENRRR